MPLVCLLCVSALVLAAHKPCPCLLPSCRQPCSEGAVPALPCVANPSLPQTHSPLQGWQSQAAAWGFPQRPPLGQPCLWLGPGRAALLCASSGTWLGLLLGSSCQGVGYPQEFSWHKKEAAVLGTRRVHLWLGLHPRVGHQRDQHLLRCESPEEPCKRCVSPQVAFEGLPG